MMTNSFSVFLLMNVLCGLLVPNFLGQAHATNPPPMMIHHQWRPSLSTTNEQAVPLFRSSRLPSKNILASRWASASSSFNLLAQCFRSGPGGGIPGPRRFVMSSPFTHAAASMKSEIVYRRRQEEGEERTNRIAVTSTSLRGGGYGDGSEMMVSATSVIPFSSWLVPGFSCATAYALYNLFIKKSASHEMDPILGGVILQFVAAAMGTVLYFGQRMFASTGSTTRSVISRQGAQWSVAAGFAVGAAELLSFIVSGKGVPATQSIPFIVGGSILLGTILGTVWLQERLSPKGWVGVALIAAGIVLVSMDPSSSGSWGN
jgi:bacterial/archaeal transporter family protein